MGLKDYYAILGLPPSASLLEIKRAYRKLAHQFHPDKNLNKSDRFQFEAIKEAYEVLTDPDRKQEYLQQRWVHHGWNRKKYQKPFTPFNLLQQALELERHCAKIDANRLDREGLFGYTMSMLTDTTIEKLNSCEDEQVNRQIILSLLKSTHHFSLRQLYRVSSQIMKIRPLDFSKQQVKNFVSQKKMRQTWERGRIWLVLIVVLLLCLIIVIASR